MTDRKHNLHRIEFASGATLSQKCDLREGCFGTIIVPAGSAAIGKTLQFLATEGETMVSSTKTLPDTGLLTTAKTLAAGANPLSSDEIREVGAAGWVKFQVNSAVGSAATIYLLWKS